MSEQQMTLGSLPERAGRQLGVCKWMTLDQQRIDQFAECTGDHEWIHVDVEGAKRDSPFGSTIAHGHLTLALLAPTACEAFVQPPGNGQP